MQLLLQPLELDSEQLLSLSVYMCLKSVLFYKNWNKAMFYMQINVKMLKLHHEPRERWLIRETGQLPS